MTERTEMKGAPRQEGAPSRVLRELIRTPAFRELLKLGLREGPPGGGAELARAALREDVEVALSLIGSSPRAINYLADLLLEALRQLSLFPTPVLRDFLYQMSEKVDRERLVELEEELGHLTRELLWDDPAAVRALRLRLIQALNASLWAGSETLDRLTATPRGEGPPDAGADPQAVAEMANALMRALSRAHSSQPRFFTEMAPFVDREAARKAAEALLSFAAQALPGILAVFAEALSHKYKSKVKVLLLGAAAASFIPLLLFVQKRVSRLKGGR